MTPERWRQVTAIFHAARTREPEARRAVLDQMCAQDASLRGEVEALLAAHAEAGRSGQTAVSIDLLPQLSPGTTFGGYRVDALIGAGGMGQVYRATDTRLRRTVALKVLTPGLADDADFGARLDREARVLASLNHTNIAAIHGLEEASGIKGLVLEFVEGPTLADVLSGAGHPALGVGKALEYAKQIALALEAAHEKGIIHRDLKPANIKITPAGLVKVLDFGIAKVGSIVGRTGLRSANAADQSSVRPTYEATHTGMILGTPAYMSPEQARGLAIDKRTDIWAFGCVVYEMLTGRGAFAADTASDSLAKIIEREPDWSALPPSVPAPIRRLIARCLQKDPTDRLRDIADARFEITEVLAAPAHSGAVAAPPSSVTQRTRALIGLAGAFIVAIMIWAVWRTLTSSSGPAPPGPLVELGITFPNNFIPAFGVSVSPNGRHVAAGVFLNSGQIWLHSFDDAQTRPLAGTEGGSGPFWSPDGSTIAFFLGTRLMTIGVNGGPATTVAEAGRSLYGGTWSRDGVIVYPVHNKLFRISASGGAPVELPLTGIAGLPLFPSFLPDGRHFVFFALRHGSSVMQLASLDSAQVTTLVACDTAGTFAPPDRLLFVRNTSLMSQRIDLGRLALTGEPDIVASGVSQGTAGQNIGVALSASSNGVLAFSASRGGSSGQLTWFTRDGKPDGVIDPPPGDAEYLNPALSPDGAAVAANVIAPLSGTWDVWLVDSARRSSRLTTGADSEYDPVWSPDGKEIVYAATRGDRLGFYKQSVTGGAPEFLLDLSDERVAIPTDWSRDGRYIFYQKRGLRWSTWALPLFGDRKPILVIDDQFNPYGAHLSPDGRWLAYDATEVDQFEVFVRRFPDGTPKKQVSHGGGVHPRWTRDGKELVYWKPGRGILAHDFSVTATDIVVGSARTLLDRPVLSLIDARTHYDITRDGQRLLVRQPFGPPRPGVRVLLNWTSKVAK